MKKLRLLFSALALLLCSTSLLASDFKADGIYYGITSSSDKTVAVTNREHYYFSSPDVYSGSIVIPESVTYNGTTYSVTSIEDHAFYSCYGLTSVVIPNSVTSIGDHAFYSCYGLTSVTIGNSVTSIGRFAFYNCYSLKSVTIPNSVKSIGEKTFAECSGLKSVTIGNSVTSIGSWAFYYCSGLTSVTIPNSVTSIGASAFQNCFGLTSVTIPNSVTSIGSCAFADCFNHTDVYCYAEKVPSTKSDAFVGYYAEYATLHVPTAAMEDYKTTEPWSCFGKIVALAEEETGIEDIAVEDVNINNAPVYNLQGMKMQNVDNLPKGIYIKGGKKYLVK